MQSEITDKCICRDHNKAAYFDLLLKNACMRTYINRKRRAKIQKSLPRERAQSPKAQLESMRHAAARL